MLRTPHMLTLLFTAATLGCAGPPIQAPETRVLARGPSDAPVARERRTTELRRTDLSTRRRVKSYRTNETIAERCKKVLPKAQQLAQTHEVDLGLVMAVARVESKYNWKARNKRSGAAGLMQVMPSTGRYFKCGNLYSMEDNLACGVRILKRYLDYFKGDPTYGVAAYHAGIVAPKRAKKAGRPPKNLHYVTKVMQVRSRFKRRGCH